MANLFRLEISPRHEDTVCDASLLTELRDAGLGDARRAYATRILLVEGALNGDDMQRAARELLVDPVVETGALHPAGQTPPAPTGMRSVEVHLRPGVMDPVAQSTLAELRAEGFAVDSVRTARRYLVATAAVDSALAAAAERTLANDCIERVVIGAEPARPAPTPPVHDTALRHVPIRDLSADELARLSREGHLFLSAEEMAAIQAHFRALRREPTDLELETLAQTWSEHCVHKTLKSAVVYRGEPMPGNDATELRYGNLLKDTIARATATLMEQRRGPECLSVFADNAGIIALDRDYGVAFKVETHNHPSAIEPYGGAATGLGGCIRDVLGCGLGARPIANTDVFCVAPGEWPYDALPKGVLHPRRVLRGVVRGVADYGNRMGIPTVNGAVHFDPRYLGNPLVFCGCIGLIPRDKVHKAARVGDAIVVIGGRTGRDGIHGATFSSAELTETHADEFSHAVQIGNAITEKRVLDAVLAARDEAGGCLYSAITDCGAGGLSSAVGEMGAEIGARVNLEAVPLKYVGLRYDEIWISEAQERMVLAVPQANLPRFLDIMRSEECEATVIGTFGAGDASGAARLIVSYAGTVVGELHMRFLHDGVPRISRTAEWRAPTLRTQGGTPTVEAGASIERLQAALRSANVASRQWIIRQYDHEVQGGSVVKPLVGRGQGPSDAAVLRPRLDSSRGVAVGCGMAPELFDVDPYWMAAAAIDEALNNVTCVGGDPSQTAILDNFCWGRVDDPQQLGALVRACQACHDAALALGTPFISGKDSLNNEFALSGDDVERLISAITPPLAAVAADAGMSADDLAARVAARIRATGRLSIPGTLLISAIALVDDVRRCVTADLKPIDATLMLVGGLPRIGHDFAAAARVRDAVHAAIRAGEIAACHDCSSGWLVALAEMAIAGDCGVDVEPAADLRDAFTAMAAHFVVQPSSAGTDAFRRRLADANLLPRPIGTRNAAARFACAGKTVEIGVLRTAWSGADASA